MYSKVTKKMSQLPPEYPEKMLDSIRFAFIKSEKTIVVLDDDPI
jgi:hypothetical protein